MGVVEFQELVDECNTKEVKLVDGSVVVYKSKDCGMTLCKDSMSYGK